MPVDPLWGSALEAGAALIGGGMSAGSNRKIARQQMNAQRQFAQHGLRWRVEDAQRAGVHPLYALGAQLPSFQPVQIPGDDMGQAVATAGAALGRGLSQRETERDALLKEMDRAHAQNEREVSLGVGAAQIDLLEAQAAESRARTLDHVMNINKERFALGATDVKVVSPEILPGQAGMQRSPPDQSWKTFDIGGGYFMDFPSGQQAGAQQAFESVEGLVPGGLTIAHNVQKYGPMWIEKALENLAKGPTEMGLRHRAAIKKWIGEYLRGDW